MMFGLTFPLISSDFSNSLYIGKAAAEVSQNEYCALYGPLHICCTIINPHDISFTKVNN